MMKLKNIRFLAKANLKGNTNTISVIATALILVISLTLISSFSKTVQRRIEEYKSDPRAKMVTIQPNFYLESDNIEDVYLTSTILEAVKNIPYVESVDLRHGEILTGNFFNITDLRDNEVSDNFFMKQVKEKDGYIDIDSLTGKEKRPVIFGKALEESPVFSCIIPDKFYPFSDDWKMNGNTQYLKGADYIGKTLTLNSDELFLSFDINALGSAQTYLSGYEFELKIVGVYRETPTTLGGPDVAFVSEETARLMDEKAIECNSPINPDLERWFNDSSLHPHIVTIDNYDNLDFLYEKLDEMNIHHSGMPEYNLPPNTMDIAIIFNTASLILTTSAIFLCLIIIIYSSVNTLTNRKKQISLLKAMGYKNNQIFFALYYEQLVLTVKAFFIGTGVSTLIIAILNYINGFTEQGNSMYLISWIDIAVYSALSLGILIVVPLICQVIMLYKLNKIQPREAMSES